MTFRFGFYGGPHASLPPIEVWFNERPSSDDLGVLYHRNVLQQMLENTKSAKPQEVAFVRSWPLAEVALNPF